MFSIDGIEWPIPCKITRKSEVRASDISGYMMDGSYFNDVEGTYLSYDVALAVPMNQRDDYTDIYETITKPVDGHTFVLPYNGGTVTITGRVENVQDVYRRLVGGATYWTDIQFTVTANNPTKEMSLSDVLARGMTPMPDIAGALEGVAYIFVDGAWRRYTEVEYENADEKYY